MKLNITRAFVVSLIIISMFFNCFFETEASDIYKKSRQYTIVFTFNREGKAVESELFHGKTIEEVEKLKQNNSNLIRTNRFNAVAWYINVQDWLGDYVSLTSKIEVITPGSKLMGTSYIHLVVEGNSGTLSEQVLMFKCENGAAKRCYAYPMDMYVGNSSIITLKSINGFIQFSDGTNTQSGFLSSKTVNRY